MKKKFLVAIIIFISIVLLVGGYALYLKMTESKKESIYDQGLIWSYGSDEAGENSESDLGGASESQADINNEGENENQSTNVATSSAVRAEDTSDPLLEEFTVYDKSEAEVKSLSFKGKPTIVMFWASWYDVCKTLMPVIEEYYGKYGKEVNFAMIDLTDNSRETMDMAKQFIDEGGYTFPCYFDKDGKAAQSCSVVSIPTTYFVDRYGRIKSSKVGMLVESDLESGFKLIIE